MLGGVAVGLLNRDRHEIASTAFELGGAAVRDHRRALDVQGEEHLWSHRPAVFIYNHRNNFDPYVAIKLVRRDWGSVAKKEIAGPCTRVMQWLTPNVAFIDRSDSAKAVEGLEPVTELLRNGVSVLVAPEGTRSTTGELGTFKKGPFRMAMDAGADRADRDPQRRRRRRRGPGSSAAAPSTSPCCRRFGDRLDADDLDERIAGVRQRFADTLADWPSRGVP